MSDCLTRHNDSLPTTDIVRGCIMFAKQHTLNVESAQDCKRNTLAEPIGDRDRARNIASEFEAAWLREQHLFERYRLCIRRGRYPRPGRRYGRDHPATRQNLPGAMPTRQRNLRRLP
jgi:hypothetical protein